jgi:dTDP-4-dehydrorhamnose 3,5-epimerase
LILRETQLSGVFILEVNAHRDERGLFARVFDAKELASAGAQTEFPEHSVAFNTAAGTLRGMHYQVGAPEAKIVRCTRGALFDVVVDLRRGSPTFAQWIGVDLDEESHRSLYIPPGCAHGYLTLCDRTEASYLISVAYRVEDARGVHFADPALRIAWPVEVTRISERDKSLPLLELAELP